MLKIYNLLFEGDEDERPEVAGNDVIVGQRTRLAKDSIDDQIDSLLLKYLSTSAIDEEEKVVSESIFSYLFEQEGEDVLDPAAEEEGKPQGSEEVEVDEEGEPSKQKIDIDKFTLSVANLVKNYQNILKPEMAIINRAQKFLRDNKNEEHEERVLDILEKQHDIRVKKYSRQGDDVGIDVPTGTGAYDAGSGGAS